MRSWDVLVSPRVTAGASDRGIIVLSRNSGNWVKIDNDSPRIYNIARAINPRRLRSFPRLWEESWREALFSRRGEGGRDGVLEGSDGLRFPSEEIREGHVIKHRQERKSPFLWKSMMFHRDQ